LKAPDEKEALALFENCDGFGKEETFTLKETVVVLPAAILPIDIPVLGLAAGTDEPPTITLPATKVPPVGMGSETTTLFTATLLVLNTTTV
jgi:hypothetical protein